MPIQYPTELKVHMRGDKIFIRENEKGGKNLVRVAYSKVQMPFTHSILFSSIFKGKHRQRYCSEGVALSTIDQIGVDK